MGKQFRWRFPHLDDGETCGFNNSGIKTFTGARIYDNLAREICQNSLDASSGNGKPVIVKFKNFKINPKKYDAVYSMRSIFESCKEYWTDSRDERLDDFVDDAIRAIDSELIDMLCISDYNTKGLSGAREDNYAKTVFNALTSSSGLTVKEGTTSAGSHGIGKGAPFGCSRLHTVFYNSYALADEVKAFKGVSRLVTHISSEDDERTQGVGFYRNVDTKLPIFGEEECDFRDLFMRDQYGTDVIVTGFKADAGWENHIEKAVLRNFFAAIHDGKLVVEIGDSVINSEKLAERISYYARLDNEEENEQSIPMSLVQDFYNTLTNPDVIVPGRICSPTNGINDVRLFLKQDDKYDNKVARMRSSEMLIETKTRNMLIHYCALVIADGDILNTILRKMENPTHDVWDPEIIENNEKEKKNADKYLRKLNKWINDTIKENCSIEETNELDLAGISQFLPFSEEDISLSSSPKSDVGPESQFEFDEVRVDKTRIRKVSLEAVKVKGTKIESDINESEGGQGGGNAHLTGGIEDSEGKDDIIVKGKGKKVLKTPRIASYRIMKAPGANTYRVVFALEEDSEFVHLQIQSIGEDGAKEPVEIEEYRFGKKKEKCNNGALTLRKLKGNELCELFIYLKHDEKMCLSLHIH